MITHYRPKHFLLVELVDPDTFHTMGEKAWWLLDPRALITLDQLRNKFGVCIVNNWHSDNGEFKLSGFRPASTTVGAVHSQHRYGRAFDCKFQEDANDVRAYVLDHTSEFPYLTTLEVGVSWVHFDVRDHGESGNNGIKLIHPG